MKIRFFRKTFKIESNHVFCYLEYICFHDHFTAIGKATCTKEDKFDAKYVDESAYPVQACDYILENIDLGKAKFYNEYNYGSYMIFRGIPVFIDSRADLYSS